MYSYRPTSVFHPLHVLFASRPFQSMAGSRTFGFLLALMCLAPLALMAQISVSPQNVQVLFPAGSSSFAVNAPAGTTWNVEVIRGIDVVGVDSPDISWVSIGSATTQTGPGTIAFTYSQNDELFPRTARFFIRVDGNSTIVAEHRFVQEPKDSAISLTPTSINIDGLGGARSINVAIGPTTPWTASSNQSWIQVLTTSGTGPGTIQIQIQPNFTGAVRNGTVNVLGASVSVTQGFVDATFTLSSTSADFPFSGGSGTVGVTVNAAGVPWQAVSNNSFITITNGGSYTGNATVTYSVAVNPNDTPRQGTITIAGQTFTVNQAANPGTPSNLTSSLSSLSFVVDPSIASVLSRTVDVGSTNEPLNFTVEIVGAPWLSVSASSGTTPASLVFTAQPPSQNPTTLSGSVIISSPDGGTITLPATLEVRSGADPGPPLDISPRSLYFNRVFGATIPPPQRIFLGNPGVVLEPELQISTNNWMTTRVVQDEAGTGILVSIRQTNLQPGTYDATVRVSFRGAAFETVVIPIRMVVLLGGGSGPAISSGGVVNAATFRAGGAPGTWISVFGSGLAATTQGWNPSTVMGSLLPTNLAGTEVFVGGVRAPLSFVSPTQVNALVPGIPERGWVPVEVRVNSQPTQGGFLFLRDADPALFVYSPANGIYPAAQNPDGVAVGPLNLFPGGPPSRPAQPTGIVVFYGTGFGATTPGIDPATYFQGAAPLVDPESLQVRVGPLPGDVIFAGLVAPGLYQINVRMPSLTDGNYFVNMRLGSLTTQPGRVLVVRQPQQ